MANSAVAFQDLARILQERSDQGTPYLEFLREPAMSAGIYMLAKDGIDTQSPHRQDELYYVLRGSAWMRAADSDQRVGPGSLIYIAAGVEHRFHDIDEELTVLVFFAPAESG